jgi:hypothetical protein
MAFGQAAGTAAAISISSHTLPKDIDQQRLRKILQKQGVYLGDSSSH